MAIFGPWGPHPAGALTSGPGPCRAVMAAAQWGANCCCAGSLPRCGPRRELPLLLLSAGHGRHWYCSLRPISTPVVVARELLFAPVLVMLWRRCCSGKADVAAVAVLCLEHAGPGVMTGVGDISAAGLT
jgi:hypothetical protein